MLKRTLLGLLLMLSVLAPSGSPHASAPVELARIAKKECVVYITRTGARYHRSNCGSLRKSRLAVSRSEALASGYTACGNCGGSDCD